MQCKPAWSRSITALFFREIQRLVPLDALQYRHEASDLRLSTVTRIIR